MKMNLLFIGAIVLAVLATFLNAFATYEIVAGVGLFTLLAFVVGILIGLYNITKKESTNFLLAYLVVVATVGIFSIVPVLGEGLTALFSNFLAVFGGAALVVGLKSLVRAGASAKG